MPNIYNAEYMFMLSILPYGSMFSECLWAGATCSVICMEVWLSKQHLLLLINESYSSICIF